MPVAYNGNQIIPAPFAAVKKQYQFADNGTKIGHVWLITLKGKLVPGKGSPDSSGNFWTNGGGTYPPDETITDSTRLSSLLRKQEYLRKLFATDGYTLEIDPIYPDASAPAKCFPRVKEVDIPEGNWVVECPYTITLEADRMYGVGEEDPFTNYVSKTQEDWALEPGDDLGRTYKLTHTIGATGKLIYSQAGDGSLANNKTAWQNAQDWVTAKMGLDSSRLVSSGVVNLSSDWGPYNYLRAEHTNEQAGSYAVTETWLAFNTAGLAAPAIEDYTVSARTDETGRVHATIEGTIKGLQSGAYAVYPGNRWANAQTYWNSISNGIYGRANAASPSLLHPLALNTTVGQNQNAGTITYNYEYTDRPATLISNARSESFTVTTDNPTDIVAQLVVLGRAAGPVAQPIGTVSVARLTLSIEAQMPPGNYNTNHNNLTNLPNMPVTDAIVATYKPTAAIVWVEKDSPVWMPQTGRYTRTTTWAYTN